MRFFRAALWAIIPVAISTVVPNHLFVQGGADGGDLRCPTASFDKHLTRIVYQ